MVLRRTLLAAALALVFIFPAATESLAPFGEEDLTFGGITYPALQPDALPGIPESELIDNGDGSWLMVCQGDGYEAVFSCDEHGEDALILNFSILDPEMEGPRGVKLGDSFNVDFNLFPSGENEMGEDLTELLYGTEGVAPWGFANYDSSAGEMSLRYVTETEGGLTVELLLRYAETYLTEIMIQTIC